MAANPLDIPSPESVIHELKRSPAPSVPAMPAVWNAKLLLTPFGGLAASPFAPSDQLVVGNSTYDATSPQRRLWRFQLYSLESKTYCDLLFETNSAGSQWYYLVSDPRVPNGAPSGAYGPFATAVRVPAQDFLVRDHFSYAGTWNVVGHESHTYSLGQAGGATWYWFKAQNGLLWRVMNVNAGNPLKIPVVGAYYTVNTPSFSAQVSSTLPGIAEWCRTHSIPGAAPSPMRSLLDLQVVFANPPSGSPQSCDLASIQAVMPGISVPAEGSIAVPAWTNQVQVFCYMMGQDNSPYYSQVWYDWDFGAQRTVFVQNGNGSFDARLDELLLKHQVGPSFQFDWQNGAWNAYCSDSQGSFVPMPVPAFVAAGEGRCRALIEGNGGFGGRPLTIWSIALGNSSGTWASNFWDWFNDRSEGVVFSLAPASSLTLIDYQTFTRNAAFPAAVFDKPAAGLPSCSGALASPRSRTLFLAPESDEVPGVVKGELRVRQNLKPRK